MKKGWRNDTAFVERRERLTSERLLRQINRIKNDVAVELYRQNQYNHPPTPIMDELWNAIREMEPTLGDANKPLAIAASYALLKGYNEKLIRERNALDAALRERDKQILTLMTNPDYQQH